MHARARDVMHCARLVPSTMGGVRRAAHARVRNGMNVWALCAVSTGGCIIAYDLWGVLKTTGQIVTYTKHATEGRDFSRSCPGEALKIFF